MKKILVRGLISFGFIALLFYLMREDIPLILQTLANIDHTLAGTATAVFIRRSWSWRAVSSLFSRSKG